MIRLSIAIFFISLFFNVNAKDYSLTSPSAKLTVKISVNENTTYSVLLNGTEIISPSAISMSLNNGLESGKNANVPYAKTISVDEEIIPVVSLKYAKTEDKYNLLTLTFYSYSLQFRAYDEGVATVGLLKVKNPLKLQGNSRCLIFPRTIK